MGLKEGDFYRFRDCYLDESGRIAVYTRGGGGNRECFCEDYEPEKMTDESLGEKHNPGCVSVMQSKNRKHPDYLTDDDDDFDCTYATFYFKVPKSLPREALATIQPEFNRDDVWQAFIAGLQKKENA